MKERTLVPCFADVGLVQLVGNAKYINHLKVICKFGILP